MTPTFTSAPRGLMLMTQEETNYEKILWESVEKRLTNIEGMLTGYMNNTNSNAIKCRSEIFKDMDAVEIRVNEKITKVDDKVNAFKLEVAKYVGYASGITGLVVFVINKIWT